MELSVASVGAELRIAAKVLEKRPRAYVALVDPELPRGEAFVRMSGWGARVHLLGEWHELENAVQASNFLCLTPVPAVSHSICAECQRRVLALVDDNLIE